MKLLPTVLFLCILACPALSTAAAPEELFSSFQNDTTYQNVLIERIISADTIVLEGGKKIKLIGIKAPQAPRRPKVEYDKNGLPLEQIVLPENTFEEKAFAFAYKLLVGKRVRLEFDATKSDEDFMTVAYVFIIDTKVLANTEILRYGYANLQIQPPNFKYADQLREAYQEARREKRGMQNE